MDLFHFTKITPTIFISFALFGCGVISTTEYVENNKVWGGYIPQGKYQLLVDVFLVRPDSEIRIYNHPNNLIR